MFFGIAGLGRYKPLHKVPGLGPTWFKAFKALKEAEEIYILGFSMSPYDTMVQFHFSAVVKGERKRPPDKVVVVDPNAKEIEDRFRSVFGDIETKCHYAENWFTDFALL